MLNLIDSRGLQMPDWIKIRALLWLLFETFESVLRISETQNPDTQDTVLANTIPALACLVAILYGSTGIIIRNNESNVLSYSTFKLYFSKTYPVKWLMIILPCSRENLRNLPQNSVTALPTEKSHIRLRKAPTSVTFEIQKRP